MCVCLFDLVFSVQFNKFTFFFKIYINVWNWYQEENYTEFKM